MSRLEVHSLTLFLMLGTVGAAGPLSSNWESRSPSESAQRDTGALRELRIEAPWRESAETFANSSALRYERLPEYSDPPAAGGNAAVLSSGSLSQAHPENGQQSSADGPEGDETRESFLAAVDLPGTASIAGGAALLTFIAYRFRVRLRRN